VRGPHRKDERQADQEERRRRAQPAQSNLDVRPNARKTKRHV
jgi:hypothetical protein